MRMNSNDNEKKTHVFTWKIRHFSMCARKKDEILNSPTFTAKSLDGTSWCLELYPCGYHKSKNGYNALFLRRKNDDAVFFEKECEFYLEIIDKIGNTIQCNNIIHKFGKGKSWGWYDYIKSDELVKTALCDDTLIIRCRLYGKFNEKNLYSQNTITTKFKISNHSFQWVVKNLNSITRHEAVKFPLSGSSQAEINIQIPEDDVKIYIEIDENFSGTQFMSCNFVLLDVGGKERDSRRATHLFEKAETWEFPNFLKKSKLFAERELFVKDDCFILQCDITVSDGSAVEDIEEKEDTFLTDKFPVSGVDTFTILKEDIIRMYVDNVHTDIKLKAGTEVFPAHKSLLCARSPVFLAMFDNDMAESQRGEVDIPDLDAKTIDLFLEYIYTGTANDLDYENATKLIVAADKYQVLSLKNKCAELLATVLSDANVCEILVTADLVQHDTLKASVIDYIKKQPKKIFRSEKWRHCVKNNLLLATETVSEVAILLGDLVEENQGK